MKVYNWEYHERWPIRFIVFWVIILGVTIASCIKWNRFWAILIIILSAFYIYFLLSKSPIWFVKNTEIIVKKDWLQIWSKLHPRTDFSSFMLEYHLKKEKIHNLILFTDKSRNFYTIQDSDKITQDFINQLSDHLPLNENFELSLREKFSRKLKL